MNLYHLKSFKVKPSSEKLYIVDEIDNFFSYNYNFVTDGIKSIKGDKKIEYHVSDATYISFPSNNIYLCTEQGYSNYLKERENKI